MITQEIIFETARDSWGFHGVRTYCRGRYSPDMTSPARRRDTSTGHGWSGVISASDWEGRRDRAAAYAAPYRFSDGENWPEQAETHDCQGWMVYVKNHARPWLFATKSEAVEFGVYVAKCNAVERPARCKRWPHKGAILLP